MAGLGAYGRGVYGRGSGSWVGAPCGWVCTGGNVSEGIHGHKDVCARWVIGVLRKSGGRVGMCETVGMGQGGLQSDLTEREP